MRILIYGIGVIGSLYAAKLSRAGVPVSVLARGSRLEELRVHGLLYRMDNAVCRADVCVLDTLAPNDCYDYIFLTVRAEQLHAALTALRANQSPTIVTMVNSLEPYQKWEALAGKGRILPAFPGAGGGFQNGVLEAALTPGFIQPTTFGELDGSTTSRSAALKKLFRQAGIPCQTVFDMHAWQLCHLAMVVPLADAFYMAPNGPETAGGDQAVMAQTSARLQKNFRRLRQKGVTIVPAKMNLFRFAPRPLITMVLRRLYGSQFGDRFLYRHAVKAKQEMQTLHRVFYEHLDGR